MKQQTMIIGAVIAVAVIAAASYLLFFYETDDDPFNPNPDNPVPTTDNSIRIQDGISLFTEGASDPSTSTSPIRIHNALNFYRATFDVVYDPSELSIDDPGWWGGTNPSNQYGSATIIFNSGRVSVDFTSSQSWTRSYVSMVSASFIPLEPFSIGDKYQLTLENVHIYDVGGNELEVGNIIDGKITVEETWL